MRRAGPLGLGPLTATTVLSPEQIRALCPGHPLGAAPPSAPAPGSGATPGPGPAPFGAPQPDPGPGAGATIALVVGVLVAVLAVGGGGLFLLGRTTGPAGDVEPTAATASPPPAAGPSAGTRDGEPARIADLDRFCASWTPFVTYVLEYDDRSRTMTLEELTRWAADGHLMADLHLGRVADAYGEAGPPDELAKVEEWVDLTVSPPAGWDLAAAQARSEVMLDDAEPIWSVHNKAC